MIKGGQLEVTKGEDIVKEERKEILTLGSTVL